MPSEAPHKDIFLSYASEDRERVRPLVARLEARGWSVWWDREIPVGQSWPDHIEEALGRTRVTVVVWSRDSVRSKWVRVEARAGLEKGPLVPVLLDDVTPPLEFTEIQAADLIAWRGTADTPELSRVLAALQRHLEGTVDAAPPALPPRADAPPRARRPPRRAVGLVLAAAALALAAVYGPGWWPSGPQRTVAVAVLPFMDPDGTFGEDAELVEIFRRTVSSAFAADAGWTLVDQTSPAGERRRIDQGRADSALAFDTRRGLTPSYAVAAIVERLRRAQSAVEDSLGVEGVLFQVETGQILQRVQTRAPASALRATAGHLAAELTERSSRSGGLPPAREYKPEALAAMGEGLLHLARRDVTAAGRAFAEGATLDSTHTVLLRAARVTAPFVDAPLPGVAVNEFVGHYGPDPEGARGLGRGISEMLLTDLVQAGFRIVDRSVVEHLEREQDLPNTALAGTGVRPGRIVPARYLVEGTVLVVGDSMDIEAQLVDAESGVALALPVQRASTASIFDAVVRLGWIIGREIRKQPSAVADGDLLALADLLDELGLGDLATAYRSMVGGP